MKLSVLLQKIINNRENLFGLFLIKKSKYFNKKWYLNTYPDVKKAKMDAAVHYLKYGWKEHKDPSPLFSTQQYLMQNQDVAEKGINPLVHFEKYGKKENRKIFFSGTSNDYMTLSENEKNMYDIVKNSNMFDKDWYGRYFYNSKDPVLDYIKNSINRNPSKVFYPKEYLLIYPDIVHNKVNPFIHYEKNGKYEGRAVSLADIKEYQIPENTITVEKEIEKRKSYDKKIVTVLAMFSSSAKIEEYQLYLLKGLQEISDYIVIVSDNPVYEKELIKLNGLCNAYRFKRHGEYDFGSYKYGYNHLIENNILKEDDNLLFINDSNYGPVYPFKNVIDDFKSKECDFYGLSCGRDNDIVYIQSFFYLFKSNVYSSKIFQNFITGIKKELSFGGVILNYEYKFTDTLCQAGFKYDTYVKNNEFLPHIKNIVPTKYVYTLLNSYKYPLIKAKAIQGITLENHMDAINIIKQDNIDLYNIIIGSNDYKKERKAKEVHMPSKYNIYTRYEDKLSQIQKKYAHGEKINVIFLVNMTSMFSAENLMILMQGDSRYNVKLYVIPDVRFGDKEMYRIYANTYNELKSKYEYVENSVVMDVNNENILEYKNVIKGADIVCYPSPYDVSYSLYNPYYAVQENILSIHINYGFFRSKYDRIIYNMDNYSNFWKVFLETEINYNEYRIYGQCEGKNSVITGYAKMDRLKQYMDSKQKNTRKKIIIAPHHSVDGGMNKTLSLSNFEKYADLFIELPKKYPEIDFIFRPHPVLFTVLKRPNYWGEEKVKKYLDKLTSYENVTYSTEGDYLEVFANSDGIIQDSGSFLVEYLYTGKPCCYMLKSKSDIQDKFNELGIKCLEHTYIAYNQEEILKFIDDVIVKENDYMKDERVSFAEKEIMINYPNVSRKIYEYITNILGKNNG